jgi:hypothetical protein
MEIENASYAEKKARCKTCKYARIEAASTWGWPCDECLGAVSTLVEPNKDYYQEVD